MGAWLLAPLLCTLAAAAPAPPPAPTRWVTDPTGLLSSATRSELDAQLEEHQRQSGHQVLVWIAGSLQGQPLEDFAARAFQSWKVGRAGLDDGAVLFVFAQDRQLRIEVGYGLEERVPDAVANRILQERVIPALRSGQADQAVRAGVQGLLSAIDGAAPAPPPAPRIGVMGRGEQVLLALVALLFLAVLVTHPRLALFFLFNVMGRGSSGDRGFSGGGGRSGGGGASGSW